MVDSAPSPQTVVTLGPVFDELAHAGPEHLDPVFVAGYDRKQGADPGPDVEVLRGHGMASDSTVVDLGAGSGTFALAVARHCGRVVAVDVSPEMVDLMRRRMSESGATTVDVVQAGLLTYRHTGRLPDVVHCRNALHHLPDFWKVEALRSMAGLLRSGGLLALSDLVVDARPADTDEVVERWLSGAVGDPAAGYTRQELLDHLATEFSTYRWLLEPMLDATGFEIVETTYRRSMYGSYLCVRR